MGTLEYMAPEVLLNGPASTATDVYALAVTINEVAAGVVPLSDCQRDNPKAHTILDMGYGRQELAAAVVGEGLRPILADDLPEGLPVLLTACWSAEPSERPTAAALAAELRRLQGNNGKDCNTSVIQSLLNMNSNPRTTEMELGMKADANATLKSGSDGTATNGIQPLAGNTSQPHSRAAARWQSLPWAHRARQVVAGVFETAGARGEDRMEDRHLLLCPQPLDQGATATLDAHPGVPMPLEQGAATTLGTHPGVPGPALLAVFDGHRGASAAEYARRHFEEHLSRQAGAATSSEALSAAFVEVDSRFREENAVDSEGRPNVAGCTAIAAVVAGNVLTVANAGDCRAVLCRGGAAVAVTRDHTADDETERRHVVAAGGTAALHQGSWRIGAAGLQVTRSLGDADLKSVGVTAEPETTTTQLGPDDSFLIIASDGLWDVMSSATAVGLVLDTVKEPTMCAQRLVAEALTCGSQDNITVIVAFLQPRDDSPEVVFSGGRASWQRTATFWGSQLID